MDLCLYLHSTVSFLEVDEGIIFQFLHSLQFSKLAESLFKYILCDSASQVSHKQHLNLVKEMKKQSLKCNVFKTTKWPQTDVRVTYTSSPEPHLGHDLWVWVLDWISPLHSDNIAPHLHFATHQATTGLSCCLVVFILQKAKATVLLLVVWLVVQYDII